MASSAFAELLDEPFELWRLTEAHRNVAIRTIKGFSIADMAGLRNTKEGTIKAHFIRAPQTP